MLQKIIDFIREIFTTNQDTIRPDSTKAGNRKRDVFNFEQCYGCDGTGLDQNDGLEQFMPSRYAYQDGEWRNYRKCPICNGTGYIPKIE